MKNKVCPAPWFHLSTDVNGSLRPCCKFAQPEHQTENKMPWMSEDTLDVLWNGSQFRKLRQSFIDGVQPPECEICWSEEENNVPSYRQNLLTWRKDIWNHVNFNTAEASSPRSFDFKLTNVCNMKCRICSPQASSLFLKESEKQFGSEFPNKNYWLQKKIFDTSNEVIFMSWLPFVLDIELTGGEPLLSYENQLMLKTIRDAGHADHINLTITTNGKIFNSDFNDILQCFKKVTISLSIDDICERIEYHRFPCKWNEILNNIHSYFNLSDKHSNITVYLYCTVSNLNVFYLHEYVEFFKEYVLNRRVNFGMLHYNDWFAIKNLHPYIKDLLIDKYENTTILKPVVNFLRGSGSDKTHEFLIKTDAFDSIRNQNFATTFPEWHDILYGFRRL
jgi:pyruvate-formate lyase-activating enzyme